jgi:hypothetical protein
MDRFAAMDGMCRRMTRTATRRNTRPIALTTRRGALAFAMQHPRARRRGAHHFRAPQCIALADPATYSRRETRLADPSSHSRREKPTRGGRSQLAEGERSSRGPPYLPAEGERLSRGPPYLLTEGETYSTGGRSQLAEGERSSRGPPYLPAEGEKSSPGPQKVLADAVVSGSARRYPPP